MPTTGSGKLPYPNSSAVPDVPADVLLLAQRMDLIASGWTVCADATARAALVTNGDAYEGLHVYQIDTGVLYVYRSLAWVERGTSANLQLDTTNSVINARVQAGIGKITGNNTAAANEAVTFPAAFSATPVVVVVPAGVRATGSFNPVGLSAAGFVLASAYNVSTTGFNARFDTSGTLGSTNDFYYTWTAIGAV